MMTLSPIDVDQCVEAANLLVELLSKADVTPSAEVALAILHVGVCMGRDVGVEREVLLKQASHAFAEGSCVVEVLPGVLS